MFMVGSLEQNTWTDVDALKLFEKYLMGFFKFL